MSNDGHMTSARKVSPTFRSSLTLAHDSSADACPSTPRRLRAPAPMMHVAEPVSTPRRLRAAAAFSGDTASDSARNHGYSSPIAHVPAVDACVSTPRRLRAAPAAGIPGDAGHLRQPYFAHEDRPNALSFEEVNPKIGRRHFNSSMATNTSQHFANGSLAASPPEFGVRSNTPGPSTQAAQPSPKQTTRDVPHRVSSSVAALMSSPPNFRARSRTSGAAASAQSSQLQLHSPPHATKDTKPDVPHRTSSGVANAMTNWENELPPSPPKMRPSSRAPGTPRGLQSPHMKSSGIAKTLSGRPESPKKSQGRGHSPRMATDVCLADPNSAKGLDRCSSPHRSAVGAGPRKGRTPHTPRSPPPFGSEADLHARRPEKTGLTPGASPVRDMIAAYEARTMQLRGGGTIFEKASPRRDLPVATRALLEPGNRSSQSSSFSGGVGGGVGVGSGSGFGSYTPTPAPVSPRFHVPSYSSYSPVLSKPSSAHSFTVKPKPACGGA